MIPFRIRTTPGITAIVGNSKYILIPFEFQSIVKRTCRTDRKAVVAAKV
jgi:hypothetical protein